MLKIFLVLISLFFASNSLKYVPVLNFRDNMTNTISSVPLLSMEYEVKIIGDSARVALIQHFMNPKDYAIDVEYNYPKSPDSVIDSLVINFQNENIVCSVYEKEEAKQMYDEEVSKGNTAAYSEINSNDQDIVTVKIGNIPPNEEIILVFTYIESLNLILNTFYEYRIYTTLTPRYGSSPTNPDIVSEKPNEETSPRLIFNLKIDSDSEINNFMSSSHDNVLKSEVKYSSGKYILTASFGNDEMVYANKDIVFTYEIETDIPKAIVEEFFDNNNEPSYAIQVTYVPKFNTLTVDEAKKLLQQNSTIDSMMDIKDADLEYIFVLDRSGSMLGDRITYLVQSMLKIIDLLPEKSTFNIISYGSTYTIMFDEFVVADSYNKKNAKKNLEGISADMGGTETLSALKAAVDLKGGNKPRVIYLLTDGDIYNSESAIEWVSTIKSARFFTIGIGNGISSELISGLATRGGGSWVMVPDVSDLETKMIDIVSKSLSNYLSNIHVDYDYEEIEMAPTKDHLTFVLKDESLTFYLLFNNTLLSVIKKLQITLTFDSSFNQKNNVSTIISIDLQKRRQGSIIHKLAYWEKIKDLETQLNQQKISSYTETTSTEIDYLKKEIIKLSIEYQLLNPLTAYFCKIYENLGEFDPSQEKIIIPQTTSVDYQDEPIRAEPQYEAARAPMGKSVASMGYAYSNSTTMNTAYYYVNYAGSAQADIDLPDSSDADEIDVTDDSFPDSQSTEIKKDSTSKYSSSITSINFMLLIILTYSFIRLLI